MLSILLTGCASGPFSSSRDLESGGKQEGIVVTCNGYKTWADCDQAAAKVCPRGFNLLDKDENIAIQGRSLRITCK